MLSVVVNLSVDGCSQDNLRLFATGGIFHDHWGMVLASFSYFLRNCSILYAKLMAICESLEFATQHGYYVLKVKFDSTIVDS